MDVRLDSGDIGEGNLKHRLQSAQQLRKCVRLHTQPKPFVNFTYTQAVCHLCCSCGRVHYVILSRTCTRWVGSISVTHVPPPLPPPPAPQRATLTATLSLACVLPSRTRSDRHPRFFVWPTHTTSYLSPVHGTPVFISHTHARSLVGKRSQLGLTHKTNQLLGLHATNRARFLTLPPFWILPYTNVVLLPRFKLYQSHKNLYLLSSHIQKVYTYLKLSLNYLQPFGLYLYYCIYKLEKNYKFSTYFHLTSICFMLFYRLY